ncbi:4-hydroxythreonine-4-phosphate dehydrogenase PdxA, partial [Burkholderia sp. SIMBA_019]
SAHWPGAEFVVLGDQTLMAARAAAVGVDWAAVLAGGKVSVEHVALAAPAPAGKLDAANGPYVLALLDRAIDGAVAQNYDAIVT